ncbi:MAG TPA: pilus (MSHA type) biogenesis protein MshL [Methylophilus sp.]|nr:pilus (MSHA type) biogenesis protein MshL [Methylophilus sp.]HQQ33191.1 pilus (MSHA type) biogenesis protein MshL [Methylophilus sp.]
MQIKEKNTFLPKKPFFGLFAVVVLAIFLTSCAHRSKVKPSVGHIDGKPNANMTATSNAQAAPIPKPVKSSPQLPPPKPTSKAQTYSVVVNEVPVKEILFALARESKLNIDIHPAIQGRATLNAVDQTLPAILERLAKQVDLTYHMEGNVLYITPDLPVLRTYKVDYVNMNRDTKGFIGAAAEISSTGQSASTGTGGQSSTISTSGNGANNSSRTAVNSESKNHLWESLVQNIKDLLAETDKEVIVSRIGTEADLDAPIATSEKGTSNESTNEQVKRASEARDKAKSEYKTLLAANVIANAETGVISVRATNRQHEKVQEFIDKVMSSAKRQVLIEATIVEVQLNDSFQAGIDWTRLNNPGNSGFVFGQTLGSKGFTFNPSTGAISAGEENALGATTTAGFVAGYLNPISRLGNIAASVTLLKQFGDTKVLSSPKLMVLNNQTAVLKVVNNLVYFTVQAQQSQAAVGGGVLSTITTTPNTVPVGVVMSVTPQINDTGKVNINVRPTISRVVGFVRDPNPQLVAIPSNIPQIQVREMESLLQIDSGSTAVLGGLMQDEIFKNTDKVPGLSEVPGVGKVFTGRNDANRKTELVIFLRPTVISSPSLESDELQSYKRYLPEQQLQNVLEEAE